jgi:F0F1-type ATP synthase assembly protein I
MPGRNAGAQGYDLAANVLVGFGLGWLAQHFFSGIKPWGLGGGIVLGSASGFYQLFKSQGQRGPADKTPKNGKDSPRP